MNTLLGLKIVKSLNGYQEVAEINGNPSWTRNVRDTRDDIKVINGLQSDSRSSVILYSADAAGEYYTLVTLIDGRANDFISAWVYRPWGLEISGKELEQVLSGVRAELLGNEISEARLSRLFATSYANSSACISPTITTGNTYAVRYYNKRGADYSLLEILDRGMAQKVNAQYKGIFLLDGAFGISADGCDDITSSPLNKTVLVAPPTASVLASAGGFEPYVGNTKFTQAVAATAGDKLTVTWKKDGYKSVENEYMVAESGCAITAPQTNRMMRHIDYSVFAVTDEIGRSLTDFTVTVSNQQIPKNSAFDISEAMAKDIQIKITCPGYATYTGKHDLTRRVAVRLRAVSNSYTFATRGINGEDIKFTVETKHELLCTPLEGYHSTSNLRPSTSTTNYIEYAPEGIAKKTTYIIAAVCLLLGLAIGAGVMWMVKDKTSKAEPNEYVNGQDRDKDQPKDQPQPPTVDEPKGDEQPASNLEDAIKYLNENNKWVKSDMEKFPELQGLWDEMNTFQFDKLVNHKELSGADKYNSLLIAIGQLNNDKRKKDSFLGIKNNVKENDEVITFDNYIKKLKEGSSKYPKDQSKNNQGGNSAGKGVNNGKNTNQNSQNQEQEEFLNM